MIEVMTVGEHGDYEWPTDLPEGCPPASSKPADGEYYRFVKNDPPSDADFQRPRDLPRRNPIPSDELCAYSALSVFYDPADVLVARQYIPGFGKRKVASAMLENHMGVLLNTPEVLADSSEEPITLESHTDWWVPVTAESLSTSFSMVDL